MGAVSAAHSSNAFDITNGPVGAAFGVKLNSVGFKTAMDTTNTLEHSVPATTTTLPDVQAAAPPLPARSNTIASTPSRFTEESGKAPTAFRREASSQPFPTSSTKMGPIQRDLQMQVSPSQTSQIHQLKLQPLAYASPRMDSIGGWEGRTAPKNAPGSRVAIPPARLPEAGAVDTVRIKPDARRRYEALFRSLSSTEYIEGPKVHAVYVRSRLESRMLAQIWDLVDVDNAGRLSRAQFCMGLYLIDERLSSGLIPLEVSDELWVSVMQ
ncbi:Increased rDNA silencing protein [Mortierella sp. GBA30]|nr:Increased rDNA silencing protein [Mortierella sp. GBA30]